MPFDLKKWGRTSLLLPVAQKSLVPALRCIQLQCCGIKNYTEFMEAAAWNRTVEYRSGGQTVVSEQKVPITCCKLTGFSQPPNDFDCTITPNSDNANIDTVNESTYDTSMRFVKMS